MDEASRASGFSTPEGADEEDCLGGILLNQINERAISIESALRILGVRTFRSIDNRDSDGGGLRAFFRHLYRGFLLHHADRQTRAEAGHRSQLVEYNKGEARPLTEPVSATYYRTSCTILLNYSKGRLTADVTTATPRPAGSPLPHEVHLSAKVRKNRFGGIHIQHTGSCGESTTMLHRLKAEW